MQQSAFSGSDQVLKRPYFEKLSDRLVTQLFLYFFKLCLLKKLVKFCLSFFIIK